MLHSKALLRVRRTRALLLCIVISLVASGLAMLRTLFLSFLASLCAVLFFLTSLFVGTEDMQRQSSASGERMRCMRQRTAAHQCCQPYAYRSLDPHISVHPHISARAAAYCARVTCHTHQRPHQLPAASAEPAPPAACRSTCCMQVECKRSCEVAEEARGVGEHAAAQ